LPEGAHVRLRARLLDERGRHLAGGLAHLTVGLVVAGDPVEELDRAPVRRAVLETEDRESAHRVVRVPHRELVEQWPEAVHVARVVGRERAQRDQGGAAGSGALVLKPAPQELELLAEAELRDRAVRESAHAVVVAPRGRLDLVVPLGAKRRELPLRPGGASELLGARGGLGELHQTADSERDAGPT
jgi:hypothetical protein